MSDPVREEMIKAIQDWEDEGDDSRTWGQARRSLADDLLRVIRGHTRIRFSRMSYFCCGNFRICDKELQHTLESLPEEK